MKCIVDTRKKSSVIRSVHKEHFGFTCLYWCGRLAIPLTIAAAIIFAVVYLLRVRPTVTTVADVAKADALVCLYCFLFVALGVGVNYIIIGSSDWLAERKDEKINIAEGVLQFSYRLHNWRATITIPFDDLLSVTYDERTHKLHFEGGINCTDIRKHNFSSYGTNIYEIYDYFTPSLYEHLTECGLIQ